MAESDAPVEPKEEPKEETKAEKPLLDSTKPLTQQTDKILSKLDENKEEKKDESPDKDDDKTAEDGGTDTEQPDDGKKDDENEVDEPEDQDDDRSEPVDLPPVSKYILDNLPTIQVLGHQGESGKDKMFNVKRVEDLPSNFEFSSRRDELIFNAAIASQELNARDLLAKYQQQENQTKMDEFRTQEAVDVQQDVTDLQKEGIMPKFKYKSTDAKFNDDPAVKEANEIYELYEKTNQAYFERFKDTNRTYRISYRDAADKYYAAKSRETRQEDGKKEANKQERTKVAAQVGAREGSTDTTKRRMPPGSSLNDVMRLYNRGQL